MLIACHGCDSGWCIPHSRFQATSLLGRRLQHVYGIHLISEHVQGCADIMQWSYSKQSRVVPAYMPDTGATDFHWDLISAGLIPES